MPRTGTLRQRRRRSRRHFAGRRREHQQRGTTTESSATALAAAVSVTGLSGAGESTISRALSAKTGLPPIHLDTPWRTWARRAFVRGIRRPAGSVLPERGNGVSDEWGSGCGPRRRRCVDQQRIAEELGCSRTAVTRAMQHLGIPDRPRQLPLYAQLQDRRWPPREVETGRSPADIAAEVDCPRTTAVEALLRHGLRGEPPTRTSGRRRPLRLRRR